MTDNIKSFAQALVQHIQGKADEITFHAYVDNGFCSTCWDTTDVTGIDMEALYQEIDKFSASFQKQE